MFASTWNGGLSILSLLLTTMLLIAVRTSSAAHSVTAIDVMLLPDETMIDHAQAANARLRENYPAGFALDAAHHPHISLLHRYVRTKDLDAVYAAVGKVMDKVRPAGWQLEATGYFYVIFNGLGLPGIVVRPTPELLRLQQEVIDAVAPYSVSEGTSSAFVTTPDSPAVNASTMQYVKTFIPERVGKNYNPHVTVGVGQIDFVTKMKSEPFKAFKFKVAGAAVFHLGNFGTAQKKLWAWKSTTTEPQPAKEDDRIVSGSWVLARLNGQPIAGRDISLRFDTTAGRASGSTGVNRWNGSYRMSGQSLEFGPLITTRRAGEPEAMRLEREFMQELDKVNQFAADAKRLVLSTGDKEALVFERSEQERSQQ